MRLPAIPILLLAFLASACDRRVSITTSVSEREAMETQDVLWSTLSIRSKKVPVDGSREALFNVEISSTDVIAANHILPRHGLPHGHRPKVGEPGLIPTASENHVRRVAAMEDALEEKLGVIPRIAQAKALVSLPGRDEFLAIEENVPVPKPKASVTIQFVPDAEGRPPLSEEEIRAIVASKVDGASIQDVHVKFIPLVDAPNPGTVQCPRTTMLGINLCAESKSAFLDLMLGVMALSALLATATVIVSLRAMRYSRDLTRLTAQMEKLKK
jgi:type III secretory pathway lipoprotein EscJ